MEDLDVSDLAHKDPKVATWGPPGRLTRLICFNLPWPPSVNHRYRSRVQGGRLTDVAAQWRTNARELVRAARLEHRIPVPIREPVSVLLTLYPPDARRRDVDNILKMLLDALEQGSLLADDQLVHRLIIERVAPLPGGQVGVWVAPKLAPP